MKKTVEIKSRRADGTTDRTIVRGSLELVSTIVHDLSKEGNTDFEITEVT